MNNKFLKLFSLVLFCALFLVACNKEDDLDTTPTVTPTTESVTDDHSSQVSSFVQVTTTDSTACYDITFPITFIYEDGSTVTANDETELDAIFMDEQNIPWNISYPVNLIDLETGEVVVAENEAALFNLLLQCDGFDGDDWDDDNDWDDWDMDSIAIIGSIACYDFVFPITFNLVDGSTAVVESQEDFANLIFSDNPPVDFAFPISLQSIDNDEILVANNEEELNTLIEDCPEIWGGDDDDDDDDDDWDNWGNDSIPFLGSIACYDIIFPITFTLVDGTTATLETEEGFANLIFSDNPPVGLVFPVNLQNMDTDEVVTVNSEDEIEDLIEDCPGIWGGGDDDDDDDNEWGNDENVVLLLTFASATQDTLGTEACYEYVFPVTVVNESGDVSTVNNLDAMFAVLFSDNQITDFVYPVQVVDLETGEVLTANNEEEATALIIECFEG